MLYRYELYADGEYQGVGIFQELDNTFSSDMAEGLAWPFDKELQMPPYQSFDERHTVSFFTEAGKKKFERAIEAVIQAYQEESWFEVKVLTVKEEEICHDILWFDEYQVIVREKAVTR